MFESLISYYLWIISKYIYRDLSLMVKRMTFNHSHKGSSPLDLIWEKKDVVRYKTGSFSHIYEIIIPFISIN